MKNVALTLVAFLAMAGVSLAWSVEVLPAVDLDDPADLLESYTVRFTGVNAWQDLKIVGEVHQMNRLQTTMRSSAWNSIWDTYDEEDVPAMVYDTHIRDLGLALSFGAGSTAIGVETNDQTNPAALPLGDYSRINRAGMGTFDTTGTAYTIQGQPAPSYDLLQVVLKKGEEVVLFGLFADSATSSIHAIGGAEGLRIGGVIPEPGTIMLLLTGMLCLVGIRRR